MKVFRAIALAAILCSIGSQFTQAAPIDLIVGNSWQTWDEEISAGDFFSVEFKLNTSATVQITDYFVLTDRFEIFVNGSSIGQSTLKPDWVGIGSPDPFSPPFEFDPTAAFEGGLFSSFVFNALAGDVITLKALFIPPFEVGGEPFPDSGFAIRAISGGNEGQVPEPATVGMMAVGLAGTILLRRRK